MIILFGSLVIMVVAGTLLFLNLSPEFGGEISKEAQQDYEKSAHYKNGKFFNLGHVEMHISPKDMGKSFLAYFNPPKGTIPTSPVPVQHINPETLKDYTGETRLFWFGHSAFLLQIQSKSILIDPMFGDVPAPHPMLGSKRFSKTLPVEIEALPQIDAVLISHDHYDHLDYGSIMKLKNKVKMFYTPLGVGVHLKAWGVDAEKIVEMDWWEDTVFSNLKFICTPAQHFSGRGFGDRGNTLWSSWIIQSASENIFFSGDSGYGPHFKTIGETYGPFDFAMIECGQYNPLWHEIHMFPEETAQAAVDLKVSRFMPIHWGAFKLAMHSWTEPVERVKQAAKENKLHLLTPEIGETIYVLHPDGVSNSWWE